MTTPKPTQVFPRLHFFSEPKSGSKVVQFEGETLSLSAPEDMPDRTHETNAAHAPSQRIYTLSVLSSIFRNKLPTENKTSTAKKA
jgi:hypothetical protein